MSLREINVWEDRQAAARVRSITGGNETVPTVIVGECAMVNPSARDVLVAVRAQRREDGKRARRSALLESWFVGRPRPRRAAR